MTPALTSRRTTAGPGIAPRRVLRRCRRGLGVVGSPGMAAAPALPVAILAPFDAAPTQRTPARSRPTPAFQRFATLAGAPPSRPAPGQHVTPGPPPDADMRCAPAPATFRPEALCRSRATAAALGLLGLKCCTTSARRCSTSWASPSGPRGSSSTSPRSAQEHCCHQSHAYDFPRQPRRPCPGSRP